QLAASARDVEQEVLSLERNASGAAGAEGSVCISGPPLLLSHLVIPHMRAALARMPRIDLEFVGETRDASLTRREADIALRLQRPGRPAPLPGPARRSPGLRRTCSVRCAPQALAGHPRRRAPFAPRARGGR